ncbi:hypothetical protein [Pigmentiphaga sp.]|jgi:hypothetical protein|nr:hypothetical protein [Pigmentiphaga sp.]MBX6318209.1 hypothetical protein [Pigmentiphaga sp.]
MTTFLVFGGVLVAIVGFIYLLVKVSMLFNRGDKDSHKPAAQASNQRD